LQVVRVKKIYLNFARVCAKETIVLQPDSVRNVSFERLFRCILARLQKSDRPPTRPRCSISPAI